jgi:hypothetical protein
MLIAGRHNDGKLGPRRGRAAGLVRRRSRGRWEIRASGNRHESLTRRDNRDPSSSSRISHHYLCGQYSLRRG